MSKRKAIDEESEDEEEEEEKTGKDSVKEELKSFLCNEGSKTTRIQTLTVPYEAVAVDEPWAEIQRSTIITCSNALGILSHLVTVYMNYKAQQDPSFPDLFNRNYIRQLFIHLGRQRFHTKNIIPDPHMQQYLKVHPISEEMQQLFNAGFHKRACDSLAGRILTAAKVHVKDRFEERVKQHIACDMERRVWQQHAHPAFKAYLNSAAHAIFQAAIMDDAGSAAAKIEAFLTRERVGGEPIHASWRVPTQAAAELYREQFSHFRTIPEEEWSASSKKTDRASYYEHVKRFPESCLVLLEAYRREDQSLRDVKAATLLQMNAVQPLLKSAHTLEKVVSQLGAFRVVAAPEWAVVGSKGPLTEQQQSEYKQILQETRRVRQEVWAEQQQPGFLLTPKPFTLLPVADLQPAFITLDDIGLRELYVMMQYAGDTQPAESKRGIRLWWTGAFNLHTKRYSNRAGTGRGSVKKRAVLKTQKKLIRGGVRQLWKQAWVLNEEEYALNKLVPNLPPPTLLNSLMTDGVQVKVTLCSLGKGEGEEGQAVGTKNFRKAGYKHVTKTYNIGKHSRGIFKTAKALPKGLLTDLNRLQDTSFVEVIGVDPGQKAPITWARSKLTTTTSADSFKPSGKQLGSASYNSEFSNSDYKYQTLSKANEKFEIQRKESNTPYKEALDQYSSLGASLKSAAGTDTYSTVLYSNLDVLSKEHTSTQRREFRFARFRARQRTLAKMVRLLAGGDPVAAAISHDKKVATGTIRDNSKRAALRKRVRDKIAATRGARNWTRIVFFGNAEFGHGSRGPVPKKDLLMMLAARSVVVLTDEFRSSIKCCGCGGRLVQADSSRVFSCQAHEHVPTSCTVSYIDRDINASVNIALCGVAQLLGLARPAHLVRPRRAGGEIDEEAVEEGV